MLSPAEVAVVQEALETDKTLVENEINLKCVYVAAAKGLAVH